MNVQVANFKTGKEVRTFIRETYPNAVKISYRLYVGKESTKQFDLYTLDLAGTWGHIEDGKIVSYLFADLEQKGNKGANRLMKDLDDAQGNLPWGFTLIVPNLEDPNKFTLLAVGSIAETVH